MMLIFFWKSKDVGNKGPRLMVTDGLASHKKAFNAEFHNYYYQTCHYIADVALLERLNIVLIECMAQSGNARRSCEV